MKVVLDTNYLFVSFHKTKVFDIDTFREILQC